MTKRSESKQSLLRGLPSVDHLLKTAGSIPFEAFPDQILTTSALRTAVESARVAILAGHRKSLPTDEELIQAAERHLHDLFAPTLRPVINASGVIVHTNLGRATLSKGALRAVQDTAAAFSTLEYDLESGTRGSRSVHAQLLLNRVTGAEDALVVNNTAAAVLLMLTTLCQGKEVIINRGQLVEIGGGFRVPDVMVQSGAKLVEVGTTNRTHLRDYADAINENTAAILVAHHSNFKIIGFTTEPSLADLSGLAHSHNLPLLYDQGSGCLLDTTTYGLAHEPTVQEGLAAGSDLIAFSGDKLLGGPQAGVIVGRTDLVQACRRHPLARAVRADKICLAGLAATLTHYQKNEAEREIPVWRMIARPLSDLQETAERWAAELAAHGVQAAVVPGESTVGGGSLPGTILPSWTVALSAPSVALLAARLRQNRPHIIGRLQDDRLHLDPRTVFPEQEEALLQGIVEHGQ